ncbi:MAG: hypothetical protein ACFFB7_02835, partial [Candidatus Sifarchaeia archaeon]
TYTRLRFDEYLVQNRLDSDYGLSNMFGYRSCYQGIVATQDKEHYVSLQIRSEIDKKSVTSNQPIARFRNVCELLRIAS